MQLSPLPGGQPVASAHLRPYREALEALAKCRSRYGLKAPSLAVLRALISFLPKVAETAVQDHLVWPSNATLAERADGMDERTLRRHLARLVEVGLIARQPSPNGKRFALRFRKAVVAAFGFDLSPLLHRREELIEAAREEAEQGEARDIRRRLILAALHRAEIAEAMPMQETARVRRLLRRKDVDMEGIAALLPPAPPEMSASDSQIDRQQQKTEEESYVLKETELANKDCTQPADIQLSDCMEITSEAVALSPDPVRNWQDLDRLGQILAPMLGIAPALFHRARQVMGGLAASLSVLCVLQKGETISRPAAYFCRLTQAAERGTFSLTSLLAGARHSRFSAANRPPVCS